MAVLTGVFVGLLPALRRTRRELTDDLKDATRSATAGRGQGRFRAVLVAAEVSLSLVLLVAAGLLIRSLTHLYDVKPGVRVDHTLTTGGAGNIDRQR